MKLGKRLSALRRQHGMTQQDLADHLGVSRQAVSRWEMMLSEPSTENLLKIKALFHIPLDALLKDDPDIPTVPPQEDATDKGPTGPRRPLLCDRHRYLAAALVVWSFSRVLMVVYPRSTSILTGSWVIRAIGPLFSFFLVLYLTLSILYYTDKWFPQHRALLQPLLTLCLLLVWLLLCSRRRTHALVMNGSAFSLPAVACGVMAYLIKQRKTGCVCKRK